MLSLLTEGRRFLVFFGIPDPIQANHHVRDLHLALVRVPAPRAMPLLAQEEAEEVGQDEPRLRREEPTGAPGAEAPKTKATQQWQVSSRFKPQAETPRSASKAPFSTANP